MIELGTLVPTYYALAAGLGLLGQCMRGVLGLLKQYRDAGRIVLSPLHFALTQPLGALSGVLGALVFDLQGVTPTEVTSAELWNDRNFILMAISAGYFGADVIEGILRRHAPIDNKSKASL